MATKEPEVNNKTTTAAKANTGDAYKILIKPLVSEKSYIGAPQGKFYFKVSPKANKITVRKAVESVFDVNVVAVNIVNVKGKRRTFGNRAGRTSDWKKAIVTLAKGQSISGARI